MTLFENKYTGTNSTGPILQIYSSSNISVTSYNINEFSINTLVNDSNINFYNTIFRLVESNGIFVYDDDKSFEENQSTINKFVSQNERKDKYQECKLFIVIMNNIYTNYENDKNQTYDDKTPLQICDIISYNNDELLIKIENIPNLQNKYYINLSNYTNSVIKKFTVKYNYEGNNFLKIILPNNKDINEIGDNFFSKCRNLIKLNLNMLTGLKKIGNSFLEKCPHIESVNLPESITKIGIRFLSSSGIKTIDLEKCTNLVEIGHSFLELCPLIESVKLPESIKKIEDSNKTTPGIPDYSTYNYSTWNYATSNSDRHHNGTHHSDTHHNGTFDCWGHHGCIDFSGLDSCGHHGGLDSTGLDIGGVDCQC